MKLKNIPVILVLIIAAIEFSQSAATTYCADRANEGSIKWHDSNCNRYYRCWNGIALELTCPFVAPLFDSCRLQCVSDTNAVCGDPTPGNLCDNWQTPSTTTTVSGDTPPTPPVGTTTTGNDIPTAPTAPTVRPTPPTSVPLF